MESLMWTQLDQVQGPTDGLPIDEKFPSLLISFTNSQLIH